MPNSFIIMKGQPKALQIERFQMGDNGVYDVKFKSSPKTYHYRHSDVVWLKDAVWHDHLHCKVYIDDREQCNVEDIRSFQQGEQKETSVSYYDEPENGKYDIRIESHPIETILSENYDCVVPVWRKDSDLGGYLLVRKGKDCMIIYRDGDRCANIMESFVTIIPPINSHEFVVQRKDGKWGVVAHNKKKTIVEFGKYKYMWGFDSGLCLFEVETNNKRTFSNRGIINAIGDEVVKPYTYTNIYDFYGKESSYIKVEKEDNVIFLEKSDLSQTIISVHGVTKKDYREGIKKCYASIMEQENLTVNIECTLGFSVNLRTIYQTLDILKIMMAYAWEKHGYGSYKDFFQGKELETKYLSFLQYSDEVIVNDFKKYLKQFHVRTIFDDDIKALEKMEEIINSLT